MADPLAGTARFQAMLGSSNQQRVVRVDVYNGSDFIQTLPITAGSVTVDTTATTRRTCTLTVEDKGLVADPNSLVPVHITDLLHPLSGNELHIFRGFAYPDGTQDMCQLGVFRMTQPQVEDSGNAITINIQGNDRSAEISKNKWTSAYQINAGTNLAAAVIAILQNRWIAQGVPLDTSLISPTLIVLPTTTFGADLSSTNDPWADVMGLATAAGMDLYFNPQGLPVMNPILNPVQLGQNFDLIYEEGVNCTLTKLGYTLDETQTFSGVIAIGNGSGNGLAPVMSQSVINGVTYNGVWNTDPTSPTYFDPSNPDASAMGPVPYIFTTQAIPDSTDNATTAQQKINSAANAKLQTVLTAFDNPTFECVPNPAMWENDILTLIRERIGVEGNFQVSGVVIPLDVSSAQQVTLKPQKAPS
jgi:hypothetical protein